jgi:hypothetical protein
VWTADVGVSTPLVDGVTIQIHSSFSESIRWLLYMTAAPHWWVYAPDRSTKKYALQVWAADDRGGIYAEHFHGSNRGLGSEGVRLRSGRGSIPTPSSFG